MPMHPLRWPLSDEVHVLRATGSLVAGDFDEALSELERTSTRYLVAFLLRLALFAPSVAVRIAWRIARLRATASPG